MKDKSLSLFKRSYIISILYILIIYISLFEYINQSMIEIN